MAMTLISTVTLGAGGAASIDFSSIPGTYTDLLIVLSMRSTRSGFYEDLLGMKINGSTANFSYRELEGNGTSPTSGNSTNGFIGYQPALGATTSTFGNGSVYISNYAGATNKSISADIVCEHNASNAVASITTSLWSNSAAITSLSFYSMLSNTIVQYSTATLYGITKGSSGGVTVA